MPRIGYAHARTGRGEVQLRSNQGSLEISENGGDWHRPDHGVVPAARYGFKSSANGTDNALAIQAALDAAGAYGTVILPVGQFDVDAGIVRLKQARQRIIGQGFGTRLFRTADTAGFIFNIAPEPTAVPTTTALVGSGNALRFRAMTTSTAYWLNLTGDSEARTSLNGQTVFCIEFFYKPEGTISDIRYLFNAAHKRTTNSTNVECLGLRVNADGSMTFTVNIAGVVKTATSAASVIVSGVTRHIALTYDNAIIRLFVGGTLVASVAATGAVQQLTTQHLMFGPYSWDFWTNAYLFHGPEGVIDSIRILRDTRYTANFTPPTTKLTHDFATICLINFDDIDGIHIYGTVGLEARRCGFLYHTTDDTIAFGSGSGSHCEIGGIYMEQGGIWARCSVHLYLHNLLFLQAVSAIVLQNNCFLSDMRDIEVTGAGSNLPLVNTHASGVNSWTNITVGSCDYGLWLQNSGAQVQKFFGQSCLKAALMLHGGGGSTMTAAVFDANISDEATPGADANVIIDSCSTVGFYRSTLENIVNTTPNVLIDGDSPVAFDRCSWNAITGASKRIDFIGTRTLPVEINGWGQSLGDTSIPFTADASKAVISQGAAVNGLRHVHGVYTAAPASGAWLRGEVVWNKEPSAGGAPGWVCTASGTPGTWKAMANLAA